MSGIYEQIRPSVTNPTIAGIYQNVVRNVLVLRPDFQRRFVWTQEHQEEFLDTILKGYPFPEIYVCEGSVDVANLITTQFVIDGQQRLTTIKRYIDGVYDRPYKKVKAYADLSDDERGNFLRYQLVVRDLGRVSDETIHEVFRRINLTKFKLDDVEIHNAIYDGEFIQAAKRVLSQVSLRQYGVFHDSEFNRMADLHFILLVMSTLKNEGYFPEDRLVESIIADNNDSFAEKEFFENRLISTFALIDSMKLPADSIWFRKSNFFTMAVELSRTLPAVPLNLRAQLTAAEDIIMSQKNRSDSKYGQYYLYMYSGTNQRKARITRSRIFREDVLSRNDSSDDPWITPDP